MKTNYYRGIPEGKKTPINWPRYKGPTLKLHPEKNSIYRHADELLAARHRDLDTTIHVLVFLWTWSRRGARGVTNTSNNVRPGLAPPALHPVQIQRNRSMLMSMKARIITNKHQKKNQGHHASQAVVNTYWKLTNKCSAFAYKGQGAVSSDLR